MFFFIALYLVMAVGLFSVIFIILAISVIEGFKPRTSSFGLSHVSIGDRRIRKGGHNPIEIAKELS